MLETQGSPVSSAPREMRFAYWRTSALFQDVRNQKLLIALLLIVGTLAVYHTVGEHDFVNYDDTNYVTNNFRVQRGLSLENVKWAFTTTEASNWHPLTWLSHMMDCQLYGLNPAGHHLTNLAIHLLNVALLFWALQQMTGALWRSAFVAALFALHPLNIESVAWIAERKNVLSTTFWILTIWAYVKYTRHRTWKNYSLIIIAFVLGLLAKPMGVTLPFVLLLLDYWPLNRFNKTEVARRQIADESSTDSTRTFLLSETSPLSHAAFHRQLSRILLEKVPLFFITAVSCVITFIVQHSGGAVVKNTDLPIGLRLANAITSYASYVYMTFWPTRLAVFYPHPGAAISYKLVALAALFIASVTLWALWQGKRRPYLVVGWLWYLGTLVPVIGIVQVGEQAMADRYAYVPLIGLFMIIAWGVSELMNVLPIRKPIVVAGIACLLLAIAINTREQLNYWTDSIALFTHALKVTGDNNFVAHNNLGAALMKVGLTEQGLQHFRAAVKIRPIYGEGYYNIAVALTNQGKLDEAIQYYCEALNNISKNTSYAQAFNNVGLIMLHKGNRPEALKNFLEAIRNDPNNLPARTNLGLYYYTEGKYDEAVEQYAFANQINPDPLLYFKIGIARRDEGNDQEAIANFRQALAMAPDFNAAREELDALITKSAQLQ